MRASSHTLYAGARFNRRLAVDADIHLNVARNTVILATAMAVYSAVLQLTAAVSSITFVLVVGSLIDRIGRGPALGGGLGVMAVPG